jgi:PAS domain S-box-containing protein
LNPIRILVADDHEVVRRGVRALLQSHSELEVCGEAANGREAVEAAKQLRPDIVVMDVSMPQLNGLEATRLLQSEVPSAQVIIMTQHESREMVRQAFSAGARAYLVKSALARDLLRAVDSVRRDQSFFQSELSLDKASPHIDPQAILQRGAALEKALRESEERLRFSLEASNVGTWEWDIRTGMVRWSDNMEAIHGQARGSFGGTFEGFLRQVYAEDQQRLKDAVTAAMEGEGKYYIEYRQLRDDGTMAWMEAKGKVTFDAARRPVGLRGVCMDVTERKMTEQASLQQREELEKAVAERTDALRKLSSRLLQMQDEERRRIARELHDSAGQIVAALQMNLTQIETMHRGTGSAPPPRCIAESEELLEQLSRELRTISHLLHPPLLDEAGLPSAVKWYVDGFSSRSGIQVALELTPELGRLSHPVETTIFRIMQESLTNIHRHSGSKTAQVRISREEQAVRLEIVDHGNGLRRNGSETRTVQPGVGIQGMQERVRQLGGQFEIDWSAQGTRVLAILPSEKTWMEKTRVAVDAAAAGGAPSA